MDSITQAALGGLCGELTLRKQIGWKGVGWGVAIGTLPDLDVLAFPSLDAAERLSFHRGITHSFLAMLLVSPALGWLLSALYRRQGVRFWQATLFAFFAWSTHVLIDCFTTYGTQIFEPFSDRRASLDNMSIIDIAFTLPLLLSLGLVCFFRKDSRTRSWVGRAAAIWLISYTLLSFTLKAAAERHFGNVLEERGISPERMMTSPTLSNILLWRMVADDGERYLISYWSIFDTQDRSTELTPLAKNHHLLAPFRSDRNTSAVLWFSEGWHAVVPDATEEDSVIVIDMRFTEMISQSRKAPVFAWRLSLRGEGAGKRVAMQTASFREQLDPRETLGVLRDRISGGAEGLMAVPWAWEATSL